VDPLVADDFSARPKAQAAANLTAAELCDRYGAQVYLFASMVSRGQLEADDIAQDALIRAIKALPRFRPVRGGLEGWLWTIVVNVARNHRKLAFRQAELWERLRHREAHAAAPRVEDAAVIEIGDHDLVAAVRKLPPRSRAGIALRFGADLSFAEVGRHLGISEAAAKMAVHRGLQLLRARLQEEQR
jgi:RNA polymerase sigma factor (sigma-70 family)